MQTHRIIRTALHHCTGNSRDEYLFNAGILCHAIIDEMPESADTLSFGTEFQRQAIARADRDYREPVPY